MKVIDRLDVATPIEFTFDKAWCNAMNNAWDRISTHSLGIQEEINITSDTLKELCKRVNKIQNEVEEEKMKNETTKVVNKSTKGIMSEIETYNIIVPNKVVEVVFEDGTVEKTVCHEEDEFNIETMIMVAMLKKLLGSAGNFNNYVKRAVRTWNTMIECERKEKEEAERLEKKREKLAEKSKRRYEKRKARRDEEAKAKKQAEIDEQIHIQTQAYIKAMEYMESKKTKKKSKKTDENNEK